jgi:nucleoid DNA-binding protein
MPENPGFHGILGHSPIEFLHDLDLNFSIVGLGMACQQCHSRARLSQNRRHPNSTVYEPTDRNPLQGDNVMAKSDGPKPPTKSEILNNLAEATGLSRKEVTSVLDALTTEIEKNISRKGSPGSFTIPGLCKIVVRTKPALPKRQVRNPGTGELVWAKPRPASKQVKIRPLKGLKDMVG